MDSKTLHSQDSKYLKVIKEIIRAKNKLPPIERFHSDTSLSIDLQDRILDLYVKKLLHKNEYAKAVTLCNNYLNRLEDSMNTGNRFIQKVRLNLGDILLTKLEKYNLADSIYNLVYQSSSLTLDSASIDQAYLDYRMGSVKRQLSQYHLGLTHLNKALNRLSEDSILLKAKILNEKAIIYGTWDEFKECEKLLDSALAISEKHKDTVGLKKSLLIKAILHKTTGDHAQSDQTYNILLNLTSHRLDSFEYLIRKVENLIDWKKPRMAKETFISIESLNVKIASNMKMSYLNFLQSKYHLSILEYKKALNNINTALINIYPHYRKNTFTISPPIILPFNPSEWTFLYIHQKAQILLAIHNDEKNNAYLHAAIEHYNYLDSLIKNSFYFFEPSDESHFLDLLHEIAFDAIRSLSNTETEDREEINEIITKMIQRVKARGLLKYQAMETLLDSSVINKEQLLLSRIRTESNLNILLEAHQELSSMRKSIFEHSRYKDIISNLHSIPSLQEIQKWCGYNHTFIINILYNESKGLIALFIGDSKFKVIDLHNSVGIVGLIRSLNQKLNQHKIEEYKESSKSLYKHLLYEITTEKNLIILPDAETMNIPFHTMKDSTEQLLGEKINVFYAECITNVLKKNIRDIKLKIKNPKILSLIHSDQSSTSLPYSFKEGQLLKENFNSSNIIAGNSISIQNWQSITSDSCDIFHISTHGVSSENYVECGLSFPNAPITYGTIQKTNSRNKKIVFLNICSALQGENMRGDGTLNITRAFLNSGASVVISTYRPISDYNAHRSLLTSIKDKEISFEHLRTNQSYAIFIN